MRESGDPRSLRLFPIGLGALGCAVIGTVAWLAAQTPRPPAAVPPAPTPVQGSATPAQVTPPAPQFDIVRVAPSGAAVIAGRAAPDDTVVLRQNGTAIGEAKADGNGQFVIIPPKPIAPGAADLSLSAAGADGKVTQSTAPVVVLVAPTAAAAPPVVLQTRPDAAPVLLQAPAPPGGATDGVTLDVVDYAASGALRFAGRAPAGRTVRLYVDNAPAGTAIADAAGHWALQPDIAIAVGTHRLRADLLMSDGAKVAARVELPFQRAAIPTEAAPVGDAMAAPTRIVVQPTQNLWRIARGAYGRGVRYTDIFAANRDQIRDPNLIYPGQIFAVPETPASVSRSR